MGSKGNSALSLLSTKTVICQLLPNGSLLHRDPLQRLKQSCTAHVLVLSHPSLCFLLIWTLVCNLEISLCFSCFNWKRKMINWNNTVYYSDLIMFVIYHPVIWGDFFPLTFHHAFLITYGLRETVLTQSPQQHMARKKKKSPQVKCKVKASLIAPEEPPSTANRRGWNRNWCHSLTHHEDFTFGLGPRSTRFWM